LEKQILSGEHYQLVVVGGGPAGLAAAYGAAESGVKKILILDRNSRPGGVLPQCVHDGFGLHLYGKSLTGPEYAEVWQKKISEYDIDFLTSADVLHIDYIKPFRVDCLHSSFGKGSFFCDSLVLATGCRERTLGQMKIPGSRPAGIYTAGTAQYMMNVQNYLPGKSAVILGSGDIGLIMARRLTLEGVNVKLILGEKASGLLRNHVQCVHDFGLPVLFGHTVISTHGFKRLKGVTIAPVAADKTPDLEKKQYIPCDTLLVAAGLIAETELWKNSGIDLAENLGIAADECGSTGIDGVFTCGNVNKIYDLADFVSLAGLEAGRQAAAYLQQRKYNVPNTKEKSALFSKAETISAELLSELNENEKICILCPRGCRLTGRKSAADGLWKITGNGCAKGLEYGVNEFISPKRTLTTTVKVKGGNYPLVSAHSIEPIPKELLSAAMKQIRRLEISAPIKNGEILLADLAETGISLIAGNNVEKM
jgi:CxxC motif-containing protein/NADPH-dependent 2,4-dienoyl-CoA reductase/sulfur reductase-like enzyme